MKTVKKIIMPDGEELKLGGGGGSVLFDTKLTDHILTYEESEGWALQGTYVYKEAVAGSRYGYPDFYNKCLDEKDLGTPTETTLGDSTVTLYVNTNGHTFYDIADKEAIDTWYNTYGIAWYYGIDTENERIFLPRTKYCAFTGGIKGNGMALGLTDGTKDCGLRWSTSVAVSADIDSCGANVGSTTGGHTFGKDETLGITTDTTKSGIVAEPDDSKYLYICVGNTNVESAVTDVVDVTTTENDTVPLGYSTYQNGIQPNTSWLKSQGQWNDGNVYTTFYNEFVKKIGQSFASGYVKEITEEYNDYDLVINQDDMTFRLPLLDGSEDKPDYTQGVSIPVPTQNSQYICPSDGIYCFCFPNATNMTQSYLYVNGIKTDICASSSDSKTTNRQTTTVRLCKGDAIYFTIEATSVFSSTFYPFTGNGSLYFKVANAVQNLELLDAGEVLEALSGKADISASNFTAEGKSTISGLAFPSDKYINLTLNASGATYTAPANGWFVVRMTGSLLDVSNDAIGIQAVQTTSANTIMGKTIPCKRGDIIAVRYTGTVGSIRFVYAEGEQ